MKIVHAMLFAALAATGAAAYAQDEWDAIGTRDVGAAADRDVIPVRGLARYRQIRLCAAGGPVNLLDLDVRFANGGHQDVPVRALVRAGTCTRAVDLAGADRNMTEVRLLYQRVRLRGRLRPVVTVEAR